MTERILVSILQFCVVLRLTNKIKECLSNLPDWFFLKKVPDWFVFVLYESVIVSLLYKDIYYFRPRSKPFSKLLAVKRFPVQLKYNYFVLINDSLRVS